MALPKIIALTGSRRAGKDTLANLLVSRHNYVNLKIAGRIKECAKVLFGFSDEQLEVQKDEVDARWGVSPRRALQVLGTEIVQGHMGVLLPGIGRRFWIQSFVTQDVPSHDKIVVTDVRFMHEYEELARLGALTVRIERPGAVAHDEAIDSHSSETEMQGIPAEVVLVNDGSPEDLYEAFLCAVPAEA